MKKQNEKALDATYNAIRNVKARGFVITHPKKKGHAIVEVVYPRDGAGRLRVLVCDRFGDKCEPQAGSAGGYGYDKLTAALAGMTIDGYTMADHCGGGDGDRKKSGGVIEKI